ncbi:hypothetical protein [Noviherbaspirillum pedocola]|uniref:Uncharacterized protein n=1 Tax=Noviherbaspirillum pedocola TaxID=2801341 RepID=A0A934W8T4_9BURK|nr:hypothetical protein [Noviherbaspirillum pedocola]MBK4736209.1 hypothetical protein [Noviherbaspirillum pedocola]
MKPTEQKPTMFIVFTEQGSRNVARSCLLIVRTELASMEETTRALSAALTEWIASTEEGRALWQECGGAIFISDLAATDVFDDALLRACMRNHGIDFEACHGTYDEPNIAIDRVLVDPEKVQLPAPTMPARLRQATAARVNLPWTDADAFAVPA